MWSQRFQISDKLLITMRILVHKESVGFSVLNRIAKRLCDEQHVGYSRAELQEMRDDSLNALRVELLGST